jgi:hypothetical protein
LIGNLLERAGFKSIEKFLVSFLCRSKSAADFAIGLVRGNPTATTIEERGVDVEAVIEAVARAISTYGTDSTLQAFVWRGLRE